FDQIDTDNVTNMSKMFYNATSLHYVDQIAKTIKANKVTDMSYMFYHARAGGPVEFNNEFNTNTVKSMKAMFAGFSRVDVNISHFRFDNLEDMSRMFMGMYEEFEYNARGSQYSTSYGVTDVIWPAKHLAPKLRDASSLFRSNTFIRKIKAPKFTAPNLKDLQFAFYGLVSVNLVDLADFDTSAVENMRAMFCYIENGFDGISDLTISLDTSSVTNMNGLFYFTNLPKKVNLSSFNTKNVTDMSYAFGMLNQSPNRAIVEEIDITGWNTSNVTNMNQMFGLSNINKIYASDSFVTTKVTNGSDMFYRSWITGQNGTSCYGWSFAGARFDNPPTSPGCFWHK
ncbi:MAG: BspA family leucine-rich repeat surface protein, partial [Candidatus Nanosynbacter sp.]|nr:BspA family leucine-rich repeat surface protein [Candidatus Nanosynbacter sp.]